jgi:hypothetical protein
MKVELTHEELIYLQELMTGERESWFNWYMETITESASTAEAAHERYLMAKELREKFYVVDDRDPLTPGYDYHDLRHDQGFVNR